MYGGFLCYVTRKDKLRICRSRSVVKKEYYPLAQFEEALLHAGGGLHCCFSRAIDNTRLAGLSHLICVSWDTFAFVGLFSI